jgi:hypothetical protein
MVFEYMTNVGREAWSQAVYHSGKFNYHTEDCPQCQRGIISREGVTYDLAN